MHNKHTTYAQQKVVLSVIAVMCVLVPTQLHSQKQWYRLRTTPGQRLPHDTAAGLLKVFTWKLHHGDCSGAVNVYSVTNHVHRQPDSAAELLMVITLITRKLCHGDCPGALHLRSGTHHVTQAA